MSATSAVWADRLDAMSDGLSKFGQTYEDGDTLFQEGEAGEVMYVVQTGAVRISKNVGGQDKTLATLGPGEFFGEMAILNGKPRTATATVVAPTRCLVIDGRTLEEMVSKNSEIAIRLIKKLARRLDSADSLVEILLHHDPRARVLLTLTRHADAFGEPVEDGIRVRTTVESLATEVGADVAMAEETLSRAERLGLAYVAEPFVVVTDIERLRDFVDFLSMGPGVYGIPSLVE